MIVILSLLPYLSICQFYDSLSIPSFNKRTGLTCALDHLFPMGLLPIGLKPPMSGSTMTTGVTLDFVQLTPIFAPIARQHILIKKGIAIADVKSFYKSYSFHNFLVISY